MSQIKKSLPYVVVLGMAVIAFIWCIILTPEAAPKPKKFPLQKVLTVSAEEYCQSVEKKVIDFNLVGVNGSSMRNLIFDLPENTEVVVGYMGNMDTYFATALVPKGKK
jgi:hypothetical protein